MSPAPKRLAIMQPYFLPYVGYFQLIQSVDLFIIYDNIKYTKKGWINRNRFLQNGQDTTFSLPLKSASDTLNVDERELSSSFDRNKFLNQIREAYRKAPYFVQVMALLEKIVQQDEVNLFRYISTSVQMVCGYLEIGTRILKSSEVGIDHSLAGKNKVIAMCQLAGADTYINAIGGKSLYDKDEFGRSGIDLKFLKSNPLEYPQFSENFVPWLSIVDVMMFNSVQEISGYLKTGYELE